jgi:hypothetical protein
MYWWVEHSLVADNQNYKNNSHSHWLQLIYICHLYSHMIGYIHNHKFDHDILQIYHQNNETSLDNSISYQHILFHHQNAQNLAVSHSYIDKFHWWDHKNQDMWNHTMLELSSLTILFNYYIYLQIQSLFTLTVPCKHNTVPLFPVQVSLLHKLGLSKSTPTFISNIRSTV